MEKKEYNSALECIQDFDVMFEKVLKTGLNEELLYIQAEGLKNLFEEKVKEKKIKNIKVRILVNNYFLFLRFRLKTFEKMQDFRY